MPLFGTPVLRTEDERMLTVGGTYVADVDLPGAVHATFVLSTAAHARIVGLDTSAAAAAPGVLGVFTAADLDLGVYPPIDATLPRMDRPILAGDVVRFVGEPIVAIVSETPAAGADAADLVVVDLDPLPVVVDLESALAGDVLLFPDIGTNLVSHSEGGAEEADLGLDGCEAVVRARFRSPRLAPCPMEPRSAASRWEDDGRLTHWVSCQGPHPFKALLAKVYALDPEQVRVIAPDVGGSFGAKARAYPEDLLLPWLARRVGRPVRWTPTRSQDMVGLGHSRIQIQTVELGGTRDGTLQAMRVHLLADCGAHAILGPGLPRNTGALSPGPYRIPKVRWEVDAVATNTTPVTAYRGAGRPEAAALMERAVDLFAAEIGMDPAEVRRRNLIGADQFPFVSATGLTYDSGDYQPALQAALDAAGYDELRAEQQRRRDAGETVQLGIGLSVFVDRTAGLPGTEYGSTELRPDGSVLVRTGSNPYGQGHHTAWAMLVADRTGHPLDRIQVVHGDTDVVPRGSVTGGSRSAQRAGAAVAVAAETLVDRARSLAADLLEAATDDIVLDLERGGRFHVAGSPSRTIGWDDVAKSAAAGGSLGDGESGGDVDTALRCEADVGGDASYPFGAYVAVVDVDTETGGVRLRRLITVDDAGLVINPLLAEGQVHGGAAQGVAQALLEEFVYDEDGNPLTTTFADYAVISPAELPSFEGQLLETPSPTNPLGVKGIAESGTIGAPPAVQNAVVDALRPYGVTHIDMPCTPERVWQAIQSAG